MDNLAMPQSAEAELRRSEELFRQTFESSHVGMALIDADFRFLRVNAALEQMLEYRAGELSRMTLLDVTHPEHVERDGSSLRQMFEASAQSQPESQSLEKRFVTGDGRPFWVRVTRSAIADAQGKPLHVLLIVEDIDQRKQMERRVADSEERLRLAMAGARIGAFDWDIPTGWVRWSNNLAQSTGVQTEDGLLRYEEFAKLVHPEDAEAVGRALQESFATGNYQCEFRMVLPDGHVRWVDARGVVHFDEQGKPQSLLGVDIEITARKQMDQELHDKLSVLHEAEVQARQRADELAAILESVPALTFVAHDPECRRMTSSGMAHEVLRVPAGGNTSKTAPEGERPQNFRVLRDGVPIPDDELPVQFAARTGQEIRNDELTLVLGDGSRRELCGHAVPLFDAEGKTRGAVGAFLDITDRKRAEEALRESSERLRLAQQVARIGSFEWMIQTNENRWSPELEALYGFPPGGFAGTYDAWRRMVHPEDIAGVERCLQEAFATGSFTTEWRVVWPDGTVHWLAARGQVFRDDAGRPLRMVGVNLDVTEQRRAEEALEQQRELLRRTEKLAAAGQLASALAHEINNPLSGITNVLFLLERDEQLGPEAKRWAEVASTELARVSRIVKQSLSYYRVGTTPGVVDLSTVLEESVRVFEGKFSNFGIEVRTEIAAGTRVVGFIDELRQIVDNLILNAVEAMPKGGVLRVRVRSAVDGRRRGARLTIADNGCGISESDLQRVFQPFFTTKQDKGTGLGMWVVQGLVAKHDARIRLRSSQGSPRRGTVVSVFFPA